MKSINQQLLFRLDLQAKEAETQGLEKIANALTHQIEIHADNVRKSNKDYTHSSDELQQTLENLLWTGVVQASDYYGVSPDAQQMEILVSNSIENFLKDFTKLSNSPIIGPNEPVVPGELVLEIDLGD